jgi:methyl-accepting chemotaxis protein
MLKNAKIATKLLSAFAAVSLLVIIMGIVGINAQSNVFKEVQAITRGTVPQMSALSALDGSVRDMRRIQAGELLAKSDNDNELFLKYKKELLTLRDTEFVRSRAAFDSIPRSAEADKIWKDMVVNSDKYVASALEVERLLTANKTKEAQDLFLGSSKELFASLDAGLADLDARVDKTAAAREQAINATNASARWEMIVAAVVACILAFGLGWLIAKSITKPLAEVAERAGRLQRVCITDLDKGLGAMARGDLTVHVEASTTLLKFDRTDEIGEMAKTVDNLIGNAQQAIASYTNFQKIMASLIGETDALTVAAREGELSKRGNATQFHGAYHDLVAGFNNTLDLVLDPVNDATAVLQRVADRDMTARITSDYKGDHAKIKVALNTAVDNLQEALAEISGAAEQVASAADQIATSAQSLAQGASEEASTIEEVSSSLHEITSMAKTSAASAKEAETLAEAAKSGTDQGGVKMAQLAEAMGKLKSSADQTAKIVKTIDEIAFQTNLLALNAAVEAARAGDAGKGFAVVADEVRALSIRAAEAAKQTAALIEESVGQTQQGVTMTKDVQETFIDIAKRANRVREVMAEIAAANEQQTLGIEQVNTAVEQMNAVTQQTAASAEESASAAEELTAQATQVKGLVGQFTLEAGQKSQSAAPSYTPPRLQAKAPSRRLAPSPRAAVLKAAAEVIPFSDDDAASEF